VQDVVEEYVRASVVDEAGIVDPVGATARLTAAARARETERPDSLFSDPFAAELAGAEGFVALDRQNAARSGDREVVANPGFAIRTQFFDEFLLRETVGRHVEQVVLIAAGLDTRAYRLAWPGQTDLFELDQPEVLAYKEAILNPLGAQPTARLHSVAIDLRSPWSDALVKAGYQPDRPTAWLAEGLTFYLDESVVRRLFASIASLASRADRVGTDFVAIPPPGVDAATGFTTDDPVGLLRAWGWDAQRYNYDEECARLGRPWPYPGRPQSCMVIASTKN
jgi:methyltransferase (TIGR00027 family)